MEHHLRILCADEETGGIHGSRIEERKDFRHTLFQADIGIRIAHGINEENDVKPGPGGQIALGLHVVAAVVDEVGHIREEVFNVLCRDPQDRIVGVVVVTVHGEGVGNEEILYTPVVVPVFRTDNVLGECLGCAGFVRDLDPVRIQAVGGIPTAVCCVDRDVFGVLHGCCSFLSWWYWHSAKCPVQTWKSATAALPGGKGSVRCGEALPMWVR